MNKTKDEILYARANILILVTIFYNLVEGLVSVWFGIADGTLSLFAFGIDSFVEVISAVGVWHMIYRFRRSLADSRDDFERKALRITGGAFYLLSVGVTFIASWNIYMGHKPETTRWGTIIGALSIAWMWLLVHFKMKTGKGLDSSAIMADAACSRICMFLSLVLFLASIGYELTGIGMLDSIGSLIIAWLSLKEGREAFNKAKGLVCRCRGDA